MSETSKTLVKNPVLQPAQDFYALRRDGIGFIAQMASKYWTDYNVHDPGITLLEALCYAITDLAYRLDWPIENILAPKIASTDPGQPYPNQAFFTARDILTVNPVKPDDFRRLLIDLQGVRNGWIICKECACDAPYLAYCEDKALVLSYTPSADPKIKPVSVAPRGLYEALLELEADPVLGDLNDRKVERRTVLHPPGDPSPHTRIMELRFPDFSLTSPGDWEAFLTATSDMNVALESLGAAKGYDLFSDPDLKTDGDRDAYLRKHWSGILYASFKVDLLSSGKTIAIQNASLRLLSDAATKNATTAVDLKTALETTGFVQAFQAKEKQARIAIDSAKLALQTHRNLAEDYCVIKRVGIEEVAVCADVEVAADADIEEVQARIWFAIENYFNPPVPFYTLQSLMDAGVPVEDIFDGPELKAGFIKQADLENASLKANLRVSDLLNLLMDIPGVRAVNQLMLTKYDADGNPVAGAADPTYDPNTNQPIFDPNKISASWLLFISSRHQPRLYLNLSRFLFFKNGLPFLPRMDEATDTLNQLRGAAQQPKNYNARNDLDIPKGTYSNPEDYFPVQYSLPLAYGVGPEGLPTTADAARRAKAKQLKAYLMVFEQLLGNDLAQLAHTADLFSFAPSVQHTYFARLFKNDTIVGLDKIATGDMTEITLQGLLETNSEFLERRNRFLDHLLARFGEDFNEYALLLTNAAGDEVAETQLIKNKIAFLKAYRDISHDRGRAFDYRYVPDVNGQPDSSGQTLPCWPQNNPGIKRRISLLLGYPELAFVWIPTGTGFTYVLQDAFDDPMFQGEVSVSAATDNEAKYAAYRIVIERMVGADSKAYDIIESAGKFRLALYDQSNVEIGHFDFDTRAEALDRRQLLMAWSADARMIVVEHLLLRPKFPGDALYPACDEGDCVICGDKDPYSSGNEDPYSFRLTFVMPGWVPQYTDNLDLRRFADRTIQQETPSHLLAKTCWVGNDGYEDNPCDDVIGQIANLLLARGATSDGSDPTSDQACACANDIYDAFTSAFRTWYGPKIFDLVPEDVLLALISGEFIPTVKPGDVTCIFVLPTLWPDIQALMTAYFLEIALHGWQFERFERAWCEWLEANAAIDWTEERLLAHVQALLKNGLTSPAKDSDLCDCANNILTSYGAHFYEWMRSNIAAGHSFEKLTKFKVPQITLCAGMTFKSGTANNIAHLLTEHYSKYRKVSYRLWVLVTLLGQLRSTYPGATLHDCDEGSDYNPVRLDNTALGNYPIRTRLT